MITSKPILLKFERSYFKFIKYDIYCDTHSKLRDRGHNIYTTKKESDARNPPPANAPLSNIDANSRSALRFCRL